LKKKNLTTQGEKGFHKLITLQFSKESNYSKSQVTHAARLSGLIIFIFIFSLNMCNVQDIRYELKT
jgi:hypothetical protein